MKPVLNAPGTKCLKPQYDNLLSNVAFNFNLRRYMEALRGVPVTVHGRGLHSSTFHINQSLFGSLKP